MKKFKFRLERVLQYRLLVKEEKRRLLALANSKLREASDLLDRLENFESQSGLPDGGIVDVSIFAMSGLYRARLRASIVQQRLAIIQLEKERDEKLNEYVEAAKSARSLELLKEKRKQEYVEYAEKEEGKTLDEMVTQRINR
jgi:flagellar protein FliJ